MMFGTTGGIIVPFKSLRSGISLSQGGCGPPPGISPGIGVLPKATIPPITVMVPTPGARLIASQGDCAALTITAWISIFSSGAPGGRNPPGGIVVTAAPGTPGPGKSSGAKPPRGSVVAISSMADSSGVTVLTVVVGGSVGLLIVVLLFTVVGSVGELLLLFSLSLLSFE